MRRGLFLPGRQLPKPGRGCACPAWSWRVIQNLTGLVLPDGSIGRTDHLAVRFEYAEPHPMSKRCLHGCVGFVRPAVLEQRPREGVVGQGVAPIFQVFAGELQRLGRVPVATLG